MVFITDNVCKQQRNALGAYEDWEKKEYLEYIVNNPINFLLGFSQGQKQKQKEDENW